MVNGIFELIRQFRWTGSLLAQDHSEILEIAMLRECKATSAREWIGDDLYRKIVLFLADSDSRDKSRKYQLSRAWKMQPRYERSNWFTDWWYEFGGYSIPFTTEIPSFPGMLRKSCERDELAASLWKLINSTSRDQVTALRQEIDPTGRIDQVSDSFEATAYINTFDTLYCYPGSHWRGNWETEAKALLLTFDSKPTTSNDGGGR